MENLNFYFFLAFEIAGDFGGFLFFFGVIISSFFRTKENGVIKKAPKETIWTKFRKSVLGAIGARYGGFIPGLKFKWTSWRTFEVNYPVPEKKEKRDLEKEVDELKAIIKELQSRLEEKTK